MAKFFSWLFEDRSPAQASPEERVLAQRERLLACALQILNDPRAAQEIARQTIEQALRSPQLPSPHAGDASDAPLARWLDRLLVSLALSWLKAHPTSIRVTERRGEKRAAGASADAGGRVSPLREEALEIAQLTRVAQALDVLSPEARVTLVLATAQRRPLREIAELIGCDEESCSFWLNHGRKQLRRALQKELIDGQHGTRGPRAVSVSGIFNELQRGKKATARA